jgi:hypothetical protein
MAQVFGRRAQLLVKLVALAFGAITVGLLIYLASDVRAKLALGVVVDQPIPFSHKHHVGDDGIDCRYCHTQVETSAEAGMPSTAVCLSCHSQLFAHAPVLEPLRRSAASGRPLAWHRVHVLPDFVYFEHGIHVRKGVACVECHGRIDQMPLAWRESPLQMKWCLACHRDPLPHLHPKDEVFAMGAPPVSPARAQQLARAAHLQDTRRLTDCSTCHR